MSSSETLNLEQYLFKTDETWETQLSEFPAKIQSDVKESVRSGYSTGIGKHPTQGLFVLMCGQGPFIAWAEWLDEKQQNSFDNPDGDDNKSPF